MSSDRHIYMSTPPSDGGHSSMSASSSSSAPSQPPRFSRRHNEQQPHGEESSRSAVVRSPGLQQQVGAAAAAAPHSTNPTHNRHSASVSAVARGGSNVNVPATSHDRLSTGSRVAGSSRLNSTATAMNTNGHDGGNTASSTHSPAGYGRGPSRDGSGSSFPRRGGGGNRGRRKPYQEDGPNFRTDSRKVPEAELFELEPTSFPPLPGGSMLPASSVVHENALSADSSSKTLSDIVKGGAAKPQPLPVTAVDRSGQAAASVSSRPRPVPGAAADRSGPIAATPTSTPTSVSRTRPSVVDRLAVVSTNTTGSRPRPVPTAVAVTNSCDGPSKAAASNTPTPPPSRISRSTSTDSLVTAGSVEPSEPVSTLSTTPVSAPNPSSPKVPSSDAPTCNTNAADDVKMPPKLSYAQIAQRKKDANELPASDQHRPVVTKEATTVAANVNQHSAASADSHSKWRSSATPVGTSSFGSGTSYQKYRPNHFTAGHRAEPRSFNGASPPVSATDKQNVAMQ